MPEESKKVTFEDASSIDNIFTDAIEIVVNNETVHFRLGLRNKTGEKVTIKHNVILTLPHFLRLSDAIAKTLEEIEKQTDLK